MKILSGTINLTKLDKSKIETKTLKDGSEAKFYPIQVIINDEKDQYGNIASITTNRSQDERENGVKPTYLGNLKTVFENNEPQKPTGSGKSNNSDDSLPF